MYINSRPSRRPSVKVVSQNGSVQLGKKATEYFIVCALIGDLQGNHQLYISITLLCEGYALLKCFSFVFVFCLVFRGFFVLFLFCLYIIVFCFLLRLLCNNQF